MNSVQPVLAMPEADRARLPCRAHAPGYGKEQDSLPAEPPRAPQETAPPRDHEAEPYQADRAFHAMLARLTGGVSPVALSLAYIDWALHLATAPQRQVEVSQDALRCAAQFFDAALHCFSPQYKPWSLVTPKPQDRRFAAPEWQRPPFNLLAQTNG